MPVPRGLDIARRGVDSGTPMAEDNLEAYRQKRDFEKTPEPAGQREAGSAGNRFVVQKHAARRLHYDLRLEMEGVLRSWAVPRGPSLDPEEKRLAVHVEDHPLDYIDFEGVIPEGEYGAGRVIVWDHGTYECPGGKNPVAEYHKGGLHLQLHGQKLRGTWLLVRTRDEKDWLLFKKQDEFAEGGRDILEDRPESVLSGLRVEEVTGETSGTWHSRVHRLLEEMHLPRAEITEPVRPMLATLVSEVPRGPRWVFQLKYDGIRVLAEKKTAESASTRAT